MLSTELRLRRDYITMRDKYKPERITAIFVLESPPKSGKYFYDPEGLPTEPLFTAMMGMIGCSPSNKTGGLAEFMKRGFLIVDASYTPVNNLRGRDRDMKVMDGYSLLLKDLQCLTPDKETPLVLVKKNICRLMEPLLKKKRFKVANSGIIIYFLCCGQQSEFRRQIAMVMNNAGIQQNTIKKMDEVVMS